MIFRPFFQLPVFRWLAVALPMLLAACAQPTPPAPPPSAREPYLSGNACLVDMLYRNVAFNRAVDSAKPDACGVDTAVFLIDPGAPLDKSVLLNCSIARQVALWNEQVVQEAAQRYFGQKVATIQSYGGFACRGRSSDRKKLSEHAFGKAIDVGGFKLADGTVISVLKDWNEGGQKSAFLKDVARGGCQFFTEVLTPNSDADHANHFHFDIGPWRLCSL